MAHFLRNGAIWQFVWGLVIYSGIAQGQRLQSRLKARELAATRAELQALRAQLDPHFLFNTLHSLTQLAREDPRATQDALERFGELLRYVLSAGRNAQSLVALEEEIGFVRNYLALERLRLGDRLRVVEKIDAEALEIAVPPLLLQPLVENAVRHGLAPRRDGGTLRLSVELAPDVGGDRLDIEVADDGNGADAAAWCTSTGLGLQATRRQLAANFGRAGRFDVQTQPGRGFAVRLTLPAQVARGFV
jgi:sensor histidine kinase YesM